MRRGQCKRGCKRMREEIEDLRGSFAHGVARDHRSDQYLAALALGPTAQTRAEPSNGPLR